MHEVDYGGIKVEWTDDEMAKIEKFRDHAKVRNILGWGNARQGYSQLKTDEQRESYNRLLEEVKRCD